MEAYFKIKGLWKSIHGTEVEENKKIQSKAELVLLVGIYIWTALAKNYEDNALVRRVVLIQKFGSIKLKDCPKVNEYVNEIIKSAHKLRAVGRYKVQNIARCEE